jgi:hypothetical protein
MDFTYDSCIYCARKFDDKVLKWIYEPVDDEDDGDCGVCVECHEEQKAADKWRKEQREREAQRRKRFPTGPLYTHCAVCDCYIARESWGDDAMPTKCAACVDDARRYEEHKKWLSEAIEWNRQAELEAPYLIAAMKHVFGKRDVGTPSGGVS